MLSLTFKNLWANKVRFALTTFGVMLAVSFVVSAFVLGDGLRASFAKVSKDITAGVDLEVRNTADLGQRSPLPADTVSTIAEVDGVAAAVANVEAAPDAVRPTTPQGEPITTDGPPQLAFNWIDDAEMSAFTLVDGAPPRVGQFAIDVDSAARHGFVIGETYRVSVPGGAADLELAATSSFGADNATLGAVLMQMNTAEAGELFGIDGVSSVKVRLAPGADASEVQDAIRAAVPTAEVLDKATVLSETAADFTEEIDIVGNILVGFGGVALFVSVFIIYNTFAMVVSQRSRELALLRAVGAKPTQIRRSVLTEALIVGVVASAGGVGGGIGLSQGLEALFGAAGATLAAHPLILAGRTVAAALVTGVGVTLVAAVGPARRAAAAPPVVALSGAGAGAEPDSRTRKGAAAALTVAGLVAGAGGLAGVGPAAVTIALTGTGAVAVFLGVTLASPLAVGRVLDVLGWPVRRVAGVAGRLAQHNAARNPRRTATTAAALVIGLTLVSAALVVGESIKESIGARYVESARADYYLTDTLEEVRFPAGLAAEIRQAGVVSAATGFTQIEARVDGKATDVVGLDFDQAEALLDFGVDDGGFDTGVAHPVVVSVDEADDIGVGTGDVVPIEFANGARVEATIVGLFDNQAILSQDYLLDDSVLAAAGVEQAPEWLAVSFVDGSAPAATDAVVDELAARFPYASVETAAEFRERSEGMVEDILTMVDVLVALAVVIALVGIANTMALSVFERTRELGLVRAVGMTRRQVRRMVRFEAALVAAFGGVLGVGLGLLLGLAVVAALPASYASTVSVPVARVGTLLVVTTLAGVVAAWFPARRAARLDVLAAIAH